MRPEASTTGLRAAPMRRYPSTRTPSASGTIAIACASGTQARTASAAASVPCSRTQTSTLGPAPESVTPRHGSAPSRSRSLPSSGASEARPARACDPRARAAAGRAPRWQADRRAAPSAAGCRPRPRAGSRVAAPCGTPVCTGCRPARPARTRGRAAGLDAAGERGIAAERDREAAEDRGGRRCRGAPRSRRPAAAACRRRPADPRARARRRAPPRSRRSSFRCPSAAARVREGEAQPVAGQAARTAERLHDEVRRVGGKDPLALALDDHLERARMSLDDDVVPQRQRDAEAVVSRPEVRRRRRRADMDPIHLPKYGGGRRPRL